MISWRPIHMHNPWTFSAIWIIRSGVINFEQTPLQTAMNTIPGSSFCPPSQPPSWISLQIMEFVSSPLYRQSLWTYDLHLEFCLYVVGSLKYFNFKFGCQFGRHLGFFIAMTIMKHYLVHLNLPNRVVPLFWNIFMWSMVYMMYSMLNSAWVISTHLVTKVILKFWKLPRRPLVSKFNFFLILSVCMVLQAKSRNFI